MADPDAVERALNIIFVHLRGDATISVRREQAEQFLAQLDERQTRQILLLLAIARDSSAASLNGQAGEILERIPEQFRGEAAGLLDWVLECEASRSRSSSSWGG
ncbi:hypothetical protein COT78_01535 [Candidatus Berkelbacteria bacterium CG10_big_fil_rev_8_21_14_0_10_43_13]|uniref:Uncharacterized protein n=1 Tax=Candidatus Berkelbacteria bacterium CG10_big_fil_rev_8_21_14_0_10_43_13 TaxID=1974514 RepID=A0A2H0W730_9BACT|nr:MAG: hypothetical protein COT78_01535 [Candidatus Berkelbacteria bacterium CG10_big_fil_rev_8_21_14_0_10_43_13]